MAGTSNSLLSIRLLTTIPSILAQKNLILSKAWLILQRQIALFLLQTMHEIYPDLQFLPSNIGAVGVAANLPSILSQSGEATLLINFDLILLIARIFLGQITFWNDSRIVDLNPTLIIANVLNHIQVIVRSGSSGTTEAFTRYLNSTSPDWQDLVGVVSNDPVGIVGMENFIYDPSSSHMVDYLMLTPFTIAYIPCSSFVNCINEAGLQIW